MKFRAFDFADNPHVSSAYVAELNNIPEIKIREYGQWVDDILKKCSIKPAKMWFTAIEDGTFTENMESVCMDNIADDLENTNFEIKAQSVMNQLVNTHNDDVKKAKYDGYIKGLTKGLERGKYDKARGFKEGKELGMKKGRREAEAEFSTLVVEEKTESFDLGFQAGKSAGEKMGFERGYKFFEEQHKHDLARAREHGYQHGMDEGYKKGFTHGHKKGEGKGFSDGFNQGRRCYQPLALTVNKPVSEGELNVQGDVAKEIGKLLMESFDSRDLSHKDIFIKIGTNGHEIDYMVTSAQVLATKDGGYEAKIKVEQVVKPVPHKCPSFSEWIRHIGK